MINKIGILGCQSKHAEFFGSLFNVENAFPGYSAPFIFGNDAPQRLPYVQKTAHIPTVCKSTQEIIDRSDALIITYRIGHAHVQPAIDCISNGKPVFIDKPFTSTVDEVLTITNASLSHQVAVMGGSTLCFDPKLQREIGAQQSPSFAVIAYRADVHSPFGGYSFYGSHLTDLCSLLFSSPPLSVSCQKLEEAVTTSVRFPQQLALLHSTPDFSKPQLCLSTKNSLTKLTLDDQRCYFYGMQAFIKLIEKGQPDRKNLKRMVSSIQILNAMMRSLETGEETSITPQKT